MVAMRSRGIDHHNCTSSLHPSRQRLRSLPLSTGCHQNPGTTLNHRQLHTIINRPENATRTLTRRAAFPAVIAQFLSGDGSNVLPWRCDIQPIIVAASPFDEKPVLSALSHACPSSACLLRHAPNVLDKPAISDNKPRRYDEVRPSGSPVNTRTAGLTPRTAQVHTHRPRRG